MNYKKIFAVVLVVATIIFITIYGVKNIVFPYWENRARGYEDVSALFLVLEILCLIYPVCWLLKQFYGYWKRRKEIKKRF